MRLELLPPKRGSTSIRKPELTLLHLPIAWVYLGCITGICVIAAIAFTAELVVAAPCFLFTAVVLLAVVPAGIVDAPRRNRTSAPQQSRPTSHGQKTNNTGANIAVDRAQLGDG